MAKIIKFEVVDLPKIYLVGKEIRHNIEDFTKGNSRIPAFWDKCLADGTFSVLEKQQNHRYEPAYVGACIDWDTGYGTFSYICGMLFKEGVTVPDGYAIREIGGEKIGVCWIKGKDAADVTSSAHELTMQAIRNAGLCPNQMKWSMQLFTNPRFSTPDEKGEVILDYYMPIARSFESLGKRFVNSCLETYPAFKPVKDCNASENSQKQMHDFLYESIATIYSDLSMINIPYEPDDCYEHWQLMNTKPELNTKMQKIKKEFFAVYECFIKIGSAGQVLQDSLFISKDVMRITQKMKDKLHLFGLACEEKADGYFITHDKYKEMFPAWNLHCSALKVGDAGTNNIMNFLHGRFMDKKHTAAELFGKVSDPVLISELEQYFLGKGYSCRHHDIGVKYEKEYPKKQTACMCIYYEWRKINPLILDFKAPHFSKVMKFYDQMDDELKDMVFNKTKTCDGCGYCVQTDKTGKRPKLAQRLELNGVTKLKCPLFPSFVWDNVNKKMISKVRKLFDFAENVLKMKC
jgi:hypothetical protein